MSLLDKYKSGAQTILDWLGSGAQPVSKVEAQRRANICLQCPKNVPVSGLASFAPALKKVIEIRNQEQLRVAGMKKLGQCSVCSCHLGTKIFVPLEHILKHTSPEQVEEFPAHCWIKKQI